MKNDCIFCGIAAGEIPASTVYEDEHTISFLDIAPVTKGHTLVVPRTHHDPITCTPDDVLSRLIAVVRKVATVQVDVLGALGVNVAQANGALAGQVIPHIHFHVIPRYEGDDHSWTCPQKEYDDETEMLAFAEKLRNNLTKT